MSPDIVAVPIAEVGKLIASATDERYQVAVLLVSEAGLRIGEIRDCSGSTSSTASSPCRARSISTAT